MYVPVLLLEKPMKIPTKSGRKKKNDKEATVPTNWFLS